jgi:integrase
VIGRLCRCLTLEFTRIIGDTTRTRFGFDLFYSATLPPTNQLMLQAGKTITTVSKILGHSSAGVTEKIYAHAYDDKRDVVSSVSQRLRSGGDE